MSASISTKRKSIGGEFLKKAASHISGASLDYISEVMPVTSSTLSEAKHTVSSVSSSFINTTQSIFPKVRQLKMQLGFKNIANWFMERENAFDGLGGSDAELSFDIDTDSSEISESPISEIGKNANQISQAVVESSHKLVESQIAATANLLQASNQQTAVISAGFDKTNETLNKILEVLTKNTSTMIETMVADKTTAEVNDDMVASGKFNLSSYKKMVAGNLKNSEAGMLASMASMLTSGGTLKQILGPQSVIQMLLGFGIDKKFPNFKKNAAALDKAVSDTLMTSLIRLGENTDYGFKGQLARIFGIDSSRKDVDTSRSSLELKAVPFDSIAHESITNAIPGYLRKILVAVGGDDVVYDYRSRRFKSQKAIHKEFQNAMVNTGTIYNSSKHVRDAIGDDDFSSMLFDMMMTELGSRTRNGSARATVSRFSDTDETMKYLKDVVLAGMDLSQQDIEAVKKMASKLGKASSGMGAIDIMNQVGMNNVTRSMRGQQYADTADKYQVDLSAFVDSVDNNLKAIANEYGRTIKEKEQDTSTVSASGFKKNLRGVNYTNMALYEIYQKLNEGINVFQVGHKNLRHKPFPARGSEYLPPPDDYTPKRKGDHVEGAPISNSSSLHGDNSSGGQDDVNLLENQEQPDGTTENLSKGQRFLRWGKHRGAGLANAMFHGGPEDVVDAFRSIVKDVDQVIGTGIKKMFMGDSKASVDPRTGNVKMGGIFGKINDSFGDVAGFLRFKFMGGKWTDEHGKQQKGEGYLGKISNSISDFFNGNKKRKAPSLLGLFKGESSLNPEEDTKRKKIAGAATGALVAQLGFLGGPIGMIVGGLAGSALSVSGIGTKLSKFLLGEVGEDGKKTGNILNRFGKFFGKMMGYTDDMSEADKKGRKRSQFLGGLGGILAGSGLGLIGGPIGMIAFGLGGAALSTSGLGTKITDLVLGKKGTSGKRYGGLVSAIGKAGKFIATPFRWLGTGLMTAFKAGKKVIIDPILNIGKGFKYFLFGNKETGNPGLVQEVFKNTIGVAFTEAKTVISNAMSFITHKITDPISDLLFVMRKKLTYGISDFFMGRKGKDGKRSGGIFSGFANFMTEAGKDFKKGFGSVLKTIFASPFALLRILIPGARDKDGNKQSIWSKEGRSNIVGSFAGVGNAFRTGGIAAGLSNISETVSSVGRNSDRRSANFGADEIASSDDRIKDELGQRRLSRYDRRRDTAPGTIQEHFGQLIEISEEEAKRNQQAHDEQMQVQQDIVEHQHELYLLHKPAFDKMVTPGSIYTHDIHIEERLDKLLGAMSSKDGSSSITPFTGNIGLPKISGISSKDEKSKKKADNAAFSNSLIGAAVTAADEGGLDKDDAAGLERIVRGSQTGESKESMFSRFKEIVKRNVNKVEKRKGDEEKKEESFLSKMIGGIGKVLMDNWPLVLGGLALLNDGFRKFLGEALGNIGSWLVKNVPNIIKGAWDLIKGVNNEIENAAKGAETIYDPVTGEAKGVMSSDQHSEYVEDGLVKSAIGITANPVRLGKDLAIISGERAALRIGATGVQGVSKLVGGGAVAANGISKLATGAKFFAKEGAFAFKESIAAGNGVLKSIGTGFNRGMLNGTLAAKYAGGSAVAQKVAVGAGKTATEAAGVKTMMSKTFSMKTLFKPTAVANILGGVASDFAAGVGWETMDMAKHNNLRGDYGFGVNAGGYTVGNNTTKLVTTTTIGLGGGIAIGAAVGAAQATIAGTIAGAAGLTAAFAAPNGWNPIGWCALIIAGVLAVSAMIAALVNWISGLMTSKGNKDYAIRSNASKLNGVISGRVQYENGRDNPIYVYCAKESDRVLGLNEGVNVKDPDLLFGKYLKQIADGLTSSPGSEVLLYDLINNMAVQGVPFACLVAGDSDECDLNGPQANTASLGDGEQIRTGPFGGRYTQVKKSTVERNKKKVFADITANISRQDPEVAWTEENIKLVYEAGKEVVEALKSKAIIKGNGQIDTNKFKSKPTGRKVSSVNTDGWKSLDDLTRVHGSYFLTKCLVYINSKIAATKDGKQWLEDRKDDVLKLMEGLKDYFVKEAESTVAEMKANGMSDKEIEEALIAAADPKGNKATEAGGIATATIASSSVRNSKIKDSDKPDVDQEIKYLTASWAYAHPDVLQDWINRHEKESSMSPDYAKRVKSWKTEFTTDKKKQQMLRGEMANAALKFGEANGDIFDIINKFDWSDGGKIYTGNPKDPGEKHKSGFVIRGEEKGPGQGILSSLWLSGKVGQEKTPEDIHNELFGSKEHYKGSETPGETDKWWPWTSGVLGRIAEKITQYSSKDGEELTQGSSGSNWKNVLTNLPASKPVALTGIGGPSSAPHSLNESAPLPAELSNEDQKLPSPFIGSNFGFSVPSASTECDYGPRNLDGFHTGIDIAPVSGDGSIGAVGQAVVTDVSDDIPTTWGGSNYGNYVKYRLQNGIEVLNGHLAPNSIPDELKEGTVLSPGDRIGTMGTTGNSSGPHLHFETRDPSVTDQRGGHSFDPAPLFGMATTSDTGKFSPGTSSGYSGITGYDNYSSTSSDSRSSASGPLGKFVELLKNAGNAFLSAVTGGLIGNSSDKSNSSDSHASRISDNYGYNYFSSGEACSSVEEFLEIPRKEIGVTENPKDSNKTKYGEWYNMNGVPWCMIFVQWCFSQAGLPLEFRSASCSETLGWWQENHPDKVTDQPKPGDIMIQIKSEGKGHTGIVEKVNGNSVTTIEGNTSPSDAGSQDNGGCVARKERKLSDIRKFIRPVDFEALSEQAKIAKSGTIPSDIGEGAEVLWKYFKSLGYTDEAVAGILGCWTEESENKPRTIESDYLAGFPGYDKLINDRQAMNDYTKRVVLKGRENKWYRGRDGNLYPGIGLAQWTGPRGESLLNYAKKHNIDWGATATQLGFLDEELTGDYRRVPDHIQAAKTPEEAAGIWCSEFEGYDVPSGQVTRKQNARNLINLYGGKYSFGNGGIGGGRIATPPGIKIVGQKYVNTKTGDYADAPMGIGGKSAIGNVSYKSSRSRQSNRGIGGNLSIPTTSRINHKFQAPSTDDTTLFQSNEMNSSGTGDMSKIIMLMSQIIQELASINNNTGASTDLLGSLNEKDFVDKGLRDTLTAVSKSSKSNYTSRHMPTSSNNVRAVSAIARP